MSASPSSACPLLRPPADLVGRARAFGPMLVDRREDADLRRDISPETVASLADAGLFGFLKPAEWGGWQAEPEIYFDAQNAIAEHCLSTAWVFGVLNVQAFLLALFDRQAQADVWGGGGNGLVSSSFRPSGIAEPVPGGHRLSGRWSFSSGSSHCDWALLGAMAPSDGCEGPARLRLFLVPRSDYQVIDTWHSFGLKGTGSNDIVVDAAVVPDYRSWTPDAGLAVVGAQDRPGPALYRLPWLYMFSGSISNLAIGAGRGAVKAFCAASRASSPGAAGASAIADPGIAAVAHVDAEVEAADVLVKSHLAAMMAAATAGRSMPLGECLRFRAHLTGMTRKTAELVDRLMLLLGGRGIRGDNPLTRLWIDLCAARHHPGNDPGPSRAMLGGEIMQATIRKQREMGR